MAEARQALNGLARLLRRQRHERIVIAGGPRTGKSTLAKRLSGGGYRLHDGEELIGLEWSAGSLRAAGWLDGPGPWICENVAMARALRKWLVAHPVGVPADLVVQLHAQVADRSPGQQRMALGCATVWREIVPELRRRGAKIIESNQ